MTHFNGPIVKCSESEVVSTSTGLVASVTWPDLRYPCSLADKNSSATVAQHLDGNRLRATLFPVEYLESMPSNRGLEKKLEPKKLDSNNPIYHT